jgi:hypothetical protein
MAIAIHISARDALGLLRYPTVKVTAEMSKEGIARYKEKNRDDGLFLQAKHQ